VSLYNDRQREGIADGGELEIRPPGTAAWLLIKLNIKNLTAVRQAKAGLYSRPAEHRSSPEPQYSRIIAKAFGADCFNVQPHYW
jgi:hypothetical protein